LAGSRPNRTQLATTSIVPRGTSTPSMVTEKRLGRGLGSLLPPKTEAQSAPEMIAVDLIEPNRFQPRKFFDETALSELRESIRTHGVLQPVALRRDGNRYELIAGERRWRAAKGAGLKQIPAVIRESATDAEMLELALVENLQREDLDPIERALGFRRMIDDLRMTQSAVAERVGLKRSTVTNHLRLLDLAEPIQHMVARGALSMGHARALLGLAEEGDRIELADQIVQDGLSVRDVEDRVREANGAESVTSSAPVEGRPRGQEASEASLETIEPEGAPAWVRTLESRLRNALATKVMLKTADGGSGSISIEFADHSELERIVEAIAPRDRL
ncbi:MAG: ParB/RepB/Spo0J family partition protein, partial [Pseudomonadota bacterium]